MRVEFEPISTRSVRPSRSTSARRTFRGTSPWIAVLGPPGSPAPPWRNTWIVPAPSSTATRSARPSPFTSPAVIGPAPGRGARGRREDEEREEKCERRDEEDAGSPVHRKPSWGPRGGTRRPIPLAVINRHRYAPRIPSRGHAPGPPEPEDLVRARSGALEVADLREDVPPVPPRAPVRAVEGEGPLVAPQRVPELPQPRERALAL